MFDPRAARRKLKDNDPEFLPCVERLAADKARDGHRRSEQVPGVVLEGRGGRSTGIPAFELVVCAGFNQDFKRTVALPARLSFGAAFPSMPINQQRQ